jgi:hypothetical protein
MAEAWVSDEYAETATVKSVRAEYIRKFSATVEAERKEREELMRRAKALGLVLVDPATEPAPAQSQPRSIAAQSTRQPSNSQPINEEAQAPKVEDGKRIVRGRAIDKSVNVNVKSAIPSGPFQVEGNGTQYIISGSDKPSEDLVADDEAEIGTVRGRDGMKIAIPLKRTGKTGTTKINIVNNMTDQQLQTRFKQQSRASEHGHAYHERYDVTWSECNVCLGTGERNGKDCPKCKGLGEIERSSL